MCGCFSLICFLFVRCVIVMLITVICVFCFVLCITRRMLSGVACWRGQVCHQCFMKHMSNRLANTCAWPTRAARIFCELKRTALALTNQHGYVHYRTELRADVPIMPRGQNGGDSVIIWGDFFAKVKLFRRRTLGSSIATSSFIWAAITAMGSFCRNTMPLRMLLLISVSTLLTKT